MIEAHDDPARAHCDADQAVPIARPLELVQKATDMARLQGRAPAHRPTNGYESVPEPGRRYTEKLLRR